LANRQLLTDLANFHSVSMMPYLLLGLALLIAPGFEFVNGFHDTATAVATVIYTNSPEPHLALHACFLKAARPADVGPC
jgi:PiT family inorganic phosphate transporter